MASTKKNNKGPTRPLPASLAPGDAASSILVSKNDTASVLAPKGAKHGKGKVAKRKVPFRYPWQKKGRFAYQDALLESENPDGPGENLKREISENNCEAGENVESHSDDGNSLRHHLGGKSMKHYTGDGRPVTEGNYYTGGKGPIIDGSASDEEQSDIEYKQEDSDGEYMGEGRTNAKQSFGHGNRKKQKYEVKEKTPNPNGRVVGRKLVMWHRPRMVDKLMLHLQYECHRADLKLPWDKVVERLSTGSSGASALQHLNKLRDILITEGHMVPPLLGKRSVPQDVTIRGFIRDMDADKPTDTKVVRWGEHVEDRKENLEIDGVVRGSGNYRRGTYKALEKNQQASDTHQKKVSKRRYSRAVSSCLASPEPAGLASDEEYNPTFNEKASFGRSLRKSAKPIGKYKVESSGDEAEHEANDWQEDAFRNIIAFNTPRSKRLMGHDQGEEGLMTPPATKQSKVMKFKVNPCFLLKLDRESIVPKKFDDEDAGLDHELEQFDDDIEDGIENSDYDIDDPKGSQIFGEYQTPTSQPHQLNVGQPFQENLQETGYPGIVPKVEAPMYNLPARCGYTSTYQSHVLPLVHPFATSAARTFSEIHTDNISTVAKTINDHSFDGMFNIIGGSRDESVGFCGAEQLVVDPFYDGLDPYGPGTSGSSMLQKAFTPYTASGMPAMSFDNDFNMGFEDKGHFHSNNSFTTHASSSFESSMQSIAENSTTRTLSTNNPKFHDATASAALSDSGAYACYVRDDIKENVEESELF